MKKIIFIIFAISLFHQFIFGQWIAQNSGTTQHLYDVYFINNQTGWSCGDSGTVLKTTDSGSNWITIPKNIAESIESIQFLTEDIGYMGTRYSGKIYKSVDGGITWVEQVYTNTHAFNAIYFIDTLTGWATSSGNGGVFFTTNGGINWDSLYIAVGAGRDIKFINISTGWVSIGTQLYKTTNRGENWMQQIDIIGNGEISSLYFFQNNIGYIVSLELWKVYKTTNGGNNWNVITALPDCFNAHCIFFSNINTGYVSGDCGQMFSTTNGGVNWNQQQTNTSSFLKSIQFVNDSTGWAVGGAGVIIHTTTSGSIIGIEPINSNLPVKYELYQNYPNPFNPITNIRFKIAKSGFITLKIFDVKGSVIETLLNEVLKQGEFEIKWNASEYPSGVYFYKLETENYIVTKKMVLIK